MNYFTALATLLFSASGLAQVTVFRDVDFSGRTELLKFQHGVCTELGKCWEDQISSVELEEGYECRFFWERECRDTDTVLVTSGKTYFGAADNKFSSYQCFNAV